MRLFILSDTHGNQRFNQKILSLAETVDQVIHLGDDFKDATFLIDNNVSTIRVPGTWCHNYQDSMIDNRRFEEFHGWRFF